jgi:hypothetical protein
MFSDDKALQDRLVAALLRKGGTLLISHISMAELGGASDPKHVIDAEKFFRALPAAPVLDGLPAGRGVGPRAERAQQRDTVLADRALAQQCAKRRG